MSSETVRLLTALTGLPGVTSVNAVRAQGRVKHFSVAYLLENCGDGTFDALANAWPFGVVERDVRSDVVKVEFLVRPEEVEDFSRAVGRIGLPPSGRREVTLDLEFSRPVGRRAKDALRSAVRSEDCVFWDGPRARVVLSDCRDAAVVEERLRRLAQRFGLEIVKGEMRVVGSG